MGIGNAYFRFLFVIIPCHSQYDYVTFICNEVIEVMNYLLRILMIFFIDDREPNEFGGRKPCYTFKLLFQLAWLPPSASLLTST